MEDNKTTYTWGIVNNFLIVKNNESGIVNHLKKDAIRFFTNNKTKNDVFIRGEFFEVTYTVFKKDERDEFCKFLIANL